MDFESLQGAVSAIPHVGKLLAVALAVGVSIYEELQKLDSTLAAERELGEEANDIIRDITLFSKNLKANDPVHLERLAKQLKNVHEVAIRVRQHIWAASSARGRHVRKYGRKLADLYECTIETTIVSTLKEDLAKARKRLMTEFQWIKMMEGDGGGTDDAPETVKEESKQEDGHHKFSPECVRWIKRADLDDNPYLFKQMVPVCDSRYSKDGVLWYVARIPHIGGRQPGKFRPGDGAYFGFKHEAIMTHNSDFEVLIALPGSVRWEYVFGRFSEERLRPSRPVKGCYENDGTELVIARAWARAHMRTGIFSDLYLRVGKASPRLECAFVIAGKKEKKIEQYEVLVYA